MAPAGRRWKAVVGAALLLVLSTACTTVRITGTQRSSVEQRLLVRSLERAAARLDKRPFLGRRVRVDLTLQVFATALAVDTADTLFGVPSMQVPVLAVPIPEIALFKWERSRGHAEIQLYTYDQTGALITQLPDALGEAKYDRYTILILISFSASDLDEPPAEPE
jgi:hypothetical protein